ncbi:hypothetical protein AGMMS50267_12760 [Spirochaetia bacterium]|nr:hypothetical protein AGMMS50267_12760 [Spirochaetia bacterium]
MKKIITAFFVLVITAKAFCAPDFSLSAGGGVLGGYQFKDAALNNQFKDYTGATFESIIKGPTEPTQDAMRQGLFDTKEYAVNCGIYGFFDATYVEAQAAVLWSNITQTVEIPELPVFDLAGSETYTYRFTQLQFSVLAKYPFKAGKKFTISPLAGATYQVALADADNKLYNSMKIVKAKGYDVPNLGEYWNAFWIKLGAGFDYAATENFFIRCEVLYGLKLPNKYENSMADYWTESIKGMTSGPSISLGAGYKIK